MRNAASPKGSASSSKAAQAAIARQHETKSSSSSISSAIRSSATSASNMLKGQSSIRNIFQNQPSSSTVTNRLSEDEALARALQESLNEPQTGTSAGNNSNSQNTIEAPRTVEEQDLMLAQALAESQRETSNQSSAAGNGDKSCNIC